MTLKLCEAKKILAELHFTLYLHRRGKLKGVKELMFTCMDGIARRMLFRPTTSYEEIIAAAKTEIISKFDIWDKKLLFALGDEIEITWDKKRIKAIIVSCPTFDYPLYKLNSSEFPIINKSFSTLDLKFYKKAILIRSAAQPLHEDPYRSSNKA